MAVLGLLLVVVVVVLVPSVVVSLVVRLCQHLTVKSKCELATLPNLPLRMLPRTFRRTGTQLFQCMLRHHVVAK